MFLLSLAQSFWDFDWLEPPRRLPGLEREKTTKKVLERFASEKPPSQGKEKKNHPRSCLPKLVKINPAEKLTQK